jgi:hypothetical protein
VEIEGNLFRMSLPKMKRSTQFIHSSKFFRVLHYFCHKIDKFSNHSFKTSTCIFTKVTITHKDCAEIKDFAKHFTVPTYILCYFYVLKIVDTKFAKLKGLSKKQKLLIVTPQRKLNLIRNDTTNRLDR